MSDHERTLATIEKFYDAALDESLWPAALKQLTQITESQAASFWVLDGSDTPRLPTFISINFDQKSIDEYVGGMAALDPTVRYLVNHPRERIVHDGMLTRQKQDDASAYYDWHERSVETRFRMVGQVRLDQSVQAGVALHRTRKAGQYDPRDIERFEVLHRHLERALAIGFRLGSAGAMQRFSAERLDQSSSAILLLDERHRVIFANRRALELQTSADGIKLAGGRIILARKNDDTHLQGLIAKAMPTMGQPGTPAGGAMRAPRPSGKRPYAIFVALVSGRMPVLSLFRPAVCVVISDPDLVESPPSERLQAAFGLTEAEARLAALLASGEELRSAAEHLQITYGTARTRLAQIFQKTATKRQGDLIRLLLRTVAAV